MLRSRKPIAEFEVTVALGVQGAYRAVKSANGPAQHFLLAGWGVVVAGMFDGMGVPSPIIIMWAATSLLIFISVVWAPKIVLELALIADAALSVAVLSLYLTYDPTPVGNVYYTMGVNGMTSYAPDAKKEGVAMWAHVLAGFYMASHAFYLSNLVHRQRLEEKRFAAS